MGRSKKAGGNGGKGARLQKRDFREGRKDEWQTNKTSRLDSTAFEAEKALQKEDGYSGHNHILQSDVFEEYYKNCKIVPEAEWNEFMAILRTPLPTTFRINGSGKYAAQVRDKMKTDFFSKFQGETIELDGETVEKPRPIPWYPDELAWHMNFSRKQLRTVPILKEIFEFIKRENTTGTITRQETVSMVPPFFLDVKPESTVLDMCAAPGSKTFQLLEMLHQGSMYNDPSGIVVANDADAQRCHLLVHQTKRMCSPCLLVTNHDAQKFPGLKSAKHPNGQGIQFDRILCDVPCSGDGTLRKAPDLWRRWNHGMGNGLHPLQLQIVEHAARLCKVGGKIVYSTCSLNPIEDEAVVAELLRRTEGCLELLDPSAELPELPRCPGITEWQVKDKNGYYTTFADYEAAEAKLDEEAEAKFKARREEKIKEAQGKGEAVRMDDNKEYSFQRRKKGQLKSTMFSGPEVKDMKMDRCMRFLPHHADTGGFFVCVLQKTAQWPPKRAKADERAAAEAAEGAEAAGGAEAEGGEAKTEEGVKAEEGTKVEGAGEEKAIDGARGGGGRNRKGGGGRFQGLDPVVPIKDPALLDSIENFYGLGDKLALRTQLVTRTEETLKPKRLYYVSKGVKDVLVMDEDEKLKITATGVKVFERQEPKDGTVTCPFRAVQEGLHVLQPHLTKQVVHVTLEELRRIVANRTVPLPGDLKMLLPKDEEKNKELGDKPDLRLPFEDERTLREMRECLAGTCVLVPREDEEEAKPFTVAGGGDPVAVACWRGRASMSLLVSKEEAGQLADKLGKPKRSHMELSEWEAKNKA